MEISEFARAFGRAIQRAAEKSSGILGSFLFQVHVAGSPDHPVTQEEALSLIYINPDIFYKIIDVCIMDFTLDSTLVFVRVSGHHPVAYEDTFDPSDLGPFKALAPAAA